MSTISPSTGSLGVIIRSCKGAVIRWARANGYPHFAWQRGYYDYIIRDPRSLDLRLCGANSASAATSIPIRPNRYSTNTMWNQ